MREMPQQQQPQDSQEFNRRADSAALQLKQQMGLPGTQVQVGPDGRLPQPLPPEGSYARMELDRAAAQAAASQPRPTRAQDIMTEPVPVPPQGQQPQELQGQEPAPQSVQDRFRELTTQLRDERKRAAELEGTLRTERESMGARLQALESKHNEFLRQHLEQLDPDERDRILSEARMLEIADRTKKEVLDVVVPHLRDSALDRRHRDMRDLAGRYPMFDVQVHGDLIESFLEQNRACTVEQAFRAVATDEELVMRQRPTPVPSAVTGPGSRALETMGGPPKPPDPEENLRNDARALHELARSRNPADRAKHRRLTADHLARRLGMV